MICPIETPSDSPCTIERTNDRIDGVSQRASKFVSAALVESPMLCSCSVRRRPGAAGQRRGIGEI